MADQTRETNSVTSTPRSARLSDVPPKAIATVQAVRGGRGVTSRLATLGFTPGTPVRMVQNFGRGPIIVSIRDAQIALGRGEAHKILVTLDDEQGA